MPRYKLLILIFLGSLTWVMTMFKSGLNYDYGIGFWGPHGHDAVWHLSLINSLSSGNLTLPMYSGEPLKNYHFGFDVMTALLVQITKIPASFLYFQVLPVLFSVLIGFLVYYLSRNLWSVYMIYFATGLGWTVTMFRHQGLGGESLFWSQQAISTLINPPFALSIIYLLLGFIYLQKKNYFLTSIFFGTVGFIKIYAGILGLFTFFIYAIYTKKLNIIIYFLLSIICFLILFLPFNSLNNQTLIWQPFWFIHSMLNSTDRLFWPKYSEALYNYQFAGNYFKFIPAAIIALLIFYVGNLGIRLLGIYYLKKQYLPLVFLGLIFPVFFIQSGTTWNTIQFMYYSLFFLSISTGEIVKKTKYPFLIILSIILLTIPAIPATLRHYLPSRPPSAIPGSENKVLRYLKSLPPGLVVVPLYNKENFNKFIEPRPLFAYESTAYTSAYSNHPVFLEDEVNLNILNINVNNRKKIIYAIFNSTNSNYLKTLIDQNNISYIYLPDINIITPKNSPSNYGFENIYTYGPTQLWSNLQIGH